MLHFYNLFWYFKYSDSVYQVLQVSCLCHSLKKRHNNGQLLVAKDYMCEYCKINVFKSEGW